MVDPSGSRSFYGLRIFGGSIKTRHPFLQWLCGVFVHKDRNSSDGKRHYAYCLRCGRLFGNVWNGP